MRFPTRFNRYVKSKPNEQPPVDPLTGNLMVVLGSDPSPTSKTDKNSDCFHSSRIVNLNGFPAQRLVVCCSSNAAVKRQSFFDIEVWLYEDSLETWFYFPGLSELRSETVAYCDVPALLDHGRSRSDDDTHNPGTLDLYVRVALVEPKGSVTDGIYTFLLGTDVSSPGA